MFLILYRNEIPFPAFLCNLGNSSGRRENWKKNSCQACLQRDFPASSHIGGISDTSCSALPDKKMPRPGQLQFR